MRKKEGRRLKCPKCGSRNSRKMGKLSTKDGRLQRWRCLDCKKSWSRKMRAVEQVEEVSDD